MVQDQLDRFFSYINERHAIYIRRQAGVKPFWTEDKILQTYSFCNVFRELDTVTIWFSSVALAGEKMATSAGLGYAAQIDPIAGGQTPVVSQTLNLFLIQHSRMEMKKFEMVQI